MKAHLADLSDHRAFLRTAFLAMGARNLEDFSDMIGFNRRTVRRWQTGGKPTEKTLEKIVEYITDTSDSERVGILYDRHRPVYVLDQRFFVTQKPEPVLGSRQVCMVGLNFSGQKAVAMSFVPFTESLIVRDDPYNYTLYNLVEKWTPQC